VIESLLTGILNTLLTSDETIKSIQASALLPWPASSAQDPKGQPTYPQGTLSESLMSVINVDTTAAAPEARDAPEDRPLSDVPKSQDKHHDVLPQCFSGWRLHVADIDLRLRHLFQKAGAVAEHLYMDCDVGKVGIVGMVGILYVLICIALYCLYGAIVYTLQDQDMCYDPPQFFSSSSDPLLVTLPMPKRPLPLNPSPLPNLPPLPPSEPSKPSSPLDQLPVKPLVPIPWNIHRREYSSMEEYREPSPVSNPLEDPDSPMEDAPPLEPSPVTHYEPDVPEGQIYTLSPRELPIEPWTAYLTQPSSPVSRKHSLSPTSPSSAPIRQRTSREGSYQSITPSTLSPIAGTSPQSQGYQSTSHGGSADNPSSTQSSADDADSDMALNWVTINTDYLKG